PVPPRRASDRVAVYGVDDLGARLEPEGVHVAQVEAQHVVALGLEAHRLGEDGSAHVVADVAEAAGLVEALHGDHPTRSVARVEGPLCGESRDHWRWWAVRPWGRAGPRSARTPPRPAPGPARRRAASRARCG